MIHVARPPQFFLLLFSISAFLFLPHPFADLIAPLSAIFSVRLLRKKQYALLSPCGSPLPYNGVEGKLDVAIDFRRPQIWGAAERLCTTYVWTPGEGVRPGRRNENTASGKYDTDEER